jgi:hypothetical protein
VVSRSALVLAVVLTGRATVAAPARAGQRQPFLDLHSAAGLAPDGRSVTVDLLASCPLR